MSRVPCLSLAVVLVLPSCWLRSEEKPRLLLSGEERYSSHLAVAQERIEKKDWSVATTLLQKLLDLEDDVFVSVRRKAPDGKETTIVVTARSEAHRLLGNMPQEGHDFYQKEYGPQAAELVHEGRRSRDLRLAARRYLWTDAGLEAMTAILKEPRLSADARFYSDVMQRYLKADAKYLASRNIRAAEEVFGNLVDGGQNSIAAPCLDLLIDRVAVDDLRPITLFRAALIYRRNGDERFEKVWKAFRAKVGGTEGLEIGDKTLTPAQLEREVEKQKPAKVVVAGQREWRMFRGDATRSARAVGSVPFLEPLWNYEIVTEPQTRDWLKQASKHLQSVKQPILSPFHPIMVAFKGKEGDIPLVVYRSYYGFHARTLLGVANEQPPLKPGGLYWDGPSMWSIERMLREPRHIGALNQWMRPFLTQKIRPGILFENTLVGSLSADGSQVYAVEDFQIPPANPRQRYGRFVEPPRGRGDSLRNAFEHNRLQAYDLDSGKLRWEAGSWDGKDQAADSFFLSAPLTLNGKLHVLNEKEGDLRLMTLKAATGEVQSVRTLARFRDRMTEVVNRRIDAAHLAYADGILVCPTNADAVLGVEEKTGQTVWAFGYETLKKVLQPKDGESVPVEGVSRWRASAPLISHDKVILAPSDGATLACLNLRNGRLLWQHPREKDDLYVGGIIEDVVLVVSNRSCRGLKLADGKEAWKQDTGMPSGLGIAAGKLFYLPLAESSRTRRPGISIIDPVKGIVVSHVRSRKREAPGNLCFAGDVLISQTATHIVAYPLVQSEINAVDKLLKKNAKDPEALARRGDLKLDRGDLKGAIDDFHAGLREKPDIEVRGRLRDLLYEALLDLVQRDFAAAEPYLNEFKELSSGTRPLTPYLILVARGREKQGKRLEAARLYLDLAKHGADEMIEVPGDLDLKVSAAVFARKQIEALLKAATPEERKQIEKELKELLKKTGAGE